MLARLLGPSDYGQIVLFTTTVLTGGLFADVAGVYYAAAYRLASSAQPVQRGLRTTLAMYGLLTGLLAGGMLSIGVIRRVLVPGLDDFHWGAPFIAAIASVAVLNQIRGFFLGSRAFVRLGATTFAQPALLAAGALLAVAFGVRTGLGVARAQALSISIGVAVLAAFFLKGAGLPRIAHLRAGGTVGIRAAAVNWMGFLHLRIDQFLVNGFLGREDLALYGVAVTVAELVNRVPSLLGSVRFPFVAAARNEHEPLRATMRLCGIVMAVVAFASLLIGWLGPSMIAVIFGPSFTASGPLLRLLLPGSIALAGLVILNGHLAGLGYPPAKLVFMVLGLGANLLLNSLLLPTIGLAGAPLASSLSYGIWFLLVLSYLSIRRRFYRPGSGLDVCRSS